MKVRLGPAGVPHVVPELNAHVEARKHFANIRRKIKMMILLFRRETSQTSPVHTLFTYMSIHVLYDHVWLDVKGVKLYSADALVFAIELFIQVAKTLSSLSASFHLLCLRCPFSLTKLNTFSWPLLPPAHLLSSLCLTFSSLHIYIYFFILPLYTPTSSI